MTEECEFPFNVGEAESEWYAWGSWLANYPKKEIDIKDAFLFWNTAQTAIWEQRLKIDELKEEIERLKSEMGYHEAKDVIEQLVEERDYWLNKYLEESNGKTTN